MTSKSKLNALLLAVTFAGACGDPTVEPTELANRSAAELSAAGASGGNPTRDCVKKQRAYVEALMSDAGAADLSSTLHTLVSEPNFAQDIPFCTVQRP